MVGKGVREGDLMKKKREEGLGGAFVGGVEAGRGWRRKGGGTAMWHWEYFCLAAKCLKIQSPYGHHTHRVT